MMNKKAQEMSMNTIILIILGLVVLVVLIVGFTMGFKNLKERFFPENNIQTISDQCNLACSLGQQYEYCTKLIELKADKEDIKDTSCYVLNKKRATQYKIPACPAMGDCGIYSTADLAKAYCTTALAAQGADQIAVKATEVFYIDNIQLTKSTCDSLINNAAIPTTP